jgi:hypothetical protein
MPMTPHKLARELDSTRPNDALGSRSTPLAQARPADRLVPASSQPSSSCQAPQGKRLPSETNSARELVGIDLRRVGQSTSKAAGHARRSAANRLELIQCALRVGKGVVARARVGNAISDPSPRYGRLKCLYLLRRYLAKFGLCCSD